MYNKGEEEEKLEWSSNARHSSIVQEQLSDACMMRLNKAQDSVAKRLTEEENRMLVELMKTMYVPEGRECRLATINANGLNESDKKDALALFLVNFSNWIFVYYD